MRILGIDLGEKRIGISISDELGITAQGLPTINSINEINKTELIEKIKYICRMTVKLINKLQSKFI